MFKGEEAAWAELGENMACSRTLREEGGCRKGCLKELGLHREGGVDLGLRRGVTEPLGL